MEEQKKVRLDSTALSLGMLRSTPNWRDDNGLPKWANTAARRMVDMGVETKQIKHILEEMEIKRRAKVRAEIEQITGQKCPVTEFDMCLADLLNMFYTRKA